MSTVDNLDIQISTSLKQSDKQLDLLIKKLNTVSSSISKVGSTTSKISSGTNSISSFATKSTKSFKGLASAFGKFYATYFLVIRGIKGLYKSIEGTADYLEAFNYFEVSFNKIAREWKQDYSKFGYESAEAYAESFSKRAKESLSKLSGVQVVVGADGKGLLTEAGMKNLGLNIQEITQYASQLASVTNSIGQTGEVSLRTSNAFTKLAGDISSLFNQDYSAVAKNLQSGLIGQSRALYKYGIDITNATLQTYAYNLGIEKNVSEMTQAEKMQLRMIAILEQSKVSWGDLANTINSPSNMIRQFKNNLKEAGMMLGQLFIPLLQKVLPVLNGATIAIKNLLGNIAGFLGIKLDLDAFGQSGSDAFDDMSESLDDVAESAKKAKKGLRGFDELKTINTGNGADSGLGNTIDLTNEIIKATEEYEKVWQESYDKMEQKANNFADAIARTFSKIGKTITNSQGFNSLQNIVKNIYNIYYTVFSDIWNKVLKPFGENFSNELLPAIFDSYDEMFKTFETTYQQIASVFENVWEDISPSLDLLSKAMGDIMRSIRENWEEHGKPVFDLIRETIQNLGNTVQLLWDKTLFPIWKNLTKNFDELWEKHLSPIVDNVLDFAGSFVEAALTIYNNFVSPILHFFQKLIGPVIAFVVNLLADKLFATLGFVSDHISFVIKNLTELLNFVTGVFSGNWDKAWKSVKNIFKNNFNGILSILESILNSAIAGINKFLKNFTPVANLVGSILNKNVTIPEIKTISIQKFEVGGFPESASLFWANENGVPELVGTMGGKTAVASGMEITGIKDAILQSSNRDAQLMERNNQLLSALLEKEYGITDDQIGKSAQRYARDYFNRTGDEAYSF